MNTPTPLSKWHIGCQNDATYIINAPPRPITFVIQIDEPKATEIVDQHNKELTAANRRAEELVTERDDAEQALSQAYYLIMGRAAEWSNTFGHEQALQDIDDAQAALRAQIRAAKEQEDRMVVKALNMASRETVRAEEYRSIARELADRASHRKGHYISCDPEWNEETGTWENCTCGLSEELQRLEAAEKEGKC